MNLQTQAVSAALALYPVYLPQWVTPVLPPGTADGGIPQVAFKPLGVEMVIEPLTGLLNWAMAAYDVVTIYVNGVSTNVAKTIYPGEENNRFLLLVPASWFVNGFNEIFYKVKRVSGNFDDSQKLNVLYHDPAPGEPAPAGITIVFPPNIVANGVGPAEAAAGVLVTFTISFARTFDEILLVVGTWSTTITVTDPAKPITLTLTAADFQQIGDNANTPVKCMVTDQLGNGNQSATTYLDIHANRLDLPAPTVKGQTGNNFNPTLQDVRMMVPSGSLRLTDKVTAIWQGATGTPVAASFTSPQRLVSAGLEFIVPRSVVAYSLGKLVTVTYDIERNGITSTSLPLSLNILPLPTSALIPPKIIEADANNVLDVIALGTSNATLHGLLWTLIEVGQQVWLTLEGKKADGSVHNLPIWNGGGHYANQTWVSQGFWPKPVANSYLKLLGHGSRLTIKFKVSLDKSNVEATAVVFPDRTYTIKAVALIVPTLTNVLDANNVEVPEGTSTTSTTLKLKGKASNGQQVEIFDGSGASAVSKGTATAHATTGDWERTITVAQGDRRLYGKSLYHSTATYSNVRLLTVIADTWRDSVTDFSNGTAGGWAIGSAGRYGRITGGVFHHDTATGTNGFAGVVFSQSFMFTAGRTYSFSISVRNFGTAAHLLPSFSVSLSSGQTILPVATVPKTGQWIVRTASFAVPQTGNQVVSIVSHQDRGSGMGTDGGNDYQIDNVIVLRVQ